MKVEPKKVDPKKVIVTRPIMVKEPNINKFIAPLILICYILMIISALI